MEMIKKRVLETRNDEDVTEELNSSKITKFMEEVNDVFTIDEVEIYRTNIGINQIME